MSRNALYNLFCLIIVKAIIAKTCEREPITQTVYGKIRGTTSLSRDGKTFSSFKGIPYAKPPIGDLRFKAPQSPDPWNDILDATEDAPACAQKNYLFSRRYVEGSEDCLYINVYTPHCDYENNDPPELLPVMVFIHWGGFFAGYSQSYYLGPEYFMDKNVVLVTFNYRLGVLGFFSTFDDASPGNYGLKDQHAALQWVKDNIHYFCGNKDQVTLFGQSAGGASVHFHMFSPLSRGLFHRAISESGTALSLWAKPLGPEQVEIAKVQGKLVGCDFYNSTHKLVECLRNIDVEILINSGDKFKYFSIDPLTVYLPSIEKESEGNAHPFITKDPIEYIQNEEFHQVPWILGTVSEEGIIRAAPLILQSETLKKLNKKFNELMPMLIALVISTPKENIERVWTQIRNFYFGDQNIIDVHNMHSIKGLVDLYTDRSFAYSIYQTALLHWRKNHHQIWLYNFEYHGQYTYRSVFATTDKNINYEWGVSHCDELIYLFDSPAMFKEPLIRNDEYMSKALLSLWTNFATYGDPTPNDTRIPCEKWLPIKNLTCSSKDKKLHFLKVTGNYEDRSSIEFKMEYGFYKNSFKLWEELPLVENIKDLNQKHVEL